jgi:hypothetical protein
VETISLTIEQLKSEVSTLKNLQASAENPSNPRRNPVTVNQANPVDSLGSLPNTSDVLNASIATVEEFIDDSSFDVPSSSSNQLN